MNARINGQCTLNIHCSLCTSLYLTTDAHFTDVSETELQEANIKNQPSNTFSLDSLKLISDSSEKGLVEDVIMEGGNGRI